MSMRLKYSPARTGESTSVLSGTGLKETSVPGSPSVSSAVPMCQPAGSFSRGVTVMLSGRTSRGYRTTVFHEITTRCADDDAADEKPRTRGDRMKSNVILSEVIPFGTSQWRRYMSERSLLHAIVCTVSSGPPVAMCRPTRSVTGPVGPCSPGIHSAYESVSGPVCTSRVSRTWMILRGASVASTSSVIPAAALPIGGRMIIQNEHNTYRIRSRRISVPFSLLSMFGFQEYTK